jgi:hypothetical protein
MRWLALTLILATSHSGSPATGGAFPHGTATCLQGSEGPGLRLFLNQKKQCEGKVVYPYLDVYIRELPIKVGGVIVIGPENWAFRCVSSNESCEQSLGGKIVFNHYDAKSQVHSDGEYELRFKGGSSESGQFMVDCVAPCVLEPQSPSARVGDAQQAFAQLGTGAV